MDIQPVYRESVGGWISIQIFFYPDGSDPIPSGPLVGRVPVGSGGKRTGSGFGRVEGGEKKTHSGGYRVYRFKTGSGIERVSGNRPGLKKPFKTGGFSVTPLQNRDFLSNPLQIGVFSVTPFKIGVFSVSPLQNRVCFQA